MLIPLLTLALLLLVFGPQLWVRFNMHRYARHIEGMPGTGGELAEHLLRRFGLEGFVVEQTAHGDDHFDPENRAVRLSPENYSGKSITAVAVAAHEVGHALQYFRDEGIFRLRQRYIPKAILFKKAGIYLLMAAPFLALVIRAPVVLYGLIALSILLQLMGSLVHLLVLPVEWDASFGKALPILVQGDYIDASQLKGARQVLKAAALTYFAAALADVLNVGRWLVLLRR